MRRYVIARELRRPDVFRAKPNESRTGWKVRWHRFMQQRKTIRREWREPWTRA